MMSPNRRPSFDEDHVHDGYKGGSKCMKVERDSEPSADVFFTVLLSGFTWSKDVDSHVTKVMEPYHPVIMKVSTELPVHERLEIKWKYGIETEFVRIVCARSAGQERVTRDLHQARFNWTRTQPYLNVQAWENDRSETTNTQPPPAQQKERFLVKLPPSTVQPKREIQAKVWIRLSQALANARAQLKGDDLDTFKTLVSKPVPGVDPMERANRWILGSEEPKVRYQQLNTGVLTVNVERLEKENMGRRVRGWRMRWRNEVLFLA